MRHLVSIGLSLDPATLLIARVRRSSLIELIFSADGSSSKPSSSRVMTFLRVSRLLLIFERMSIVYISAIIFLADLKLDQSHTPTLANHCQRLEGSI